MIDFTPFVQDVIVTTLAFAALVILVRRTVGAIRPAPGETPCTTCAACPTPPAGTASEKEGEAATLVSLNDLRRRHGSPEQEPRGIRLIG